MSPAKMFSGPASVLCVALNPAIDLTIEVSNLRLGEVNRARRARQDAGGKGINVASCLADYAVPVAVTGQLGRENPALFEALFDAKGIDNRCLYIAGDTRVNTKIVDPGRGETTDINLPGPHQTDEEIASRMAALKAVVGSLTPALRCLVLSGSLPPGWPTDTYAALIHYAHGLGIEVLADTSGAALSEALSAAPDIVKPNRDELSEHLGRPLATIGEVIEAAHGLIESHPGVRIVAVSMGSEGAVFVSLEKSLIARPLPVEPISSVGAGDAMVAGIVAARLEDRTLDGCARLATAFAAAKLTRLGPHLPDRREVASLAEKVQIENQ